jgi:hypothetical protein
MARFRRTDTLSSVKLPPTAVIAPPKLAICPMTALFSKELPRE